MFETGIEGIAIEIALYEGRYTPPEIWEEKDEWLALVEKSKEIWNKMTTEQQDGLAYLMAHALQRMHDSMEHWLPEAMTVSTGKYLDVHFRILHTDVNEAIIKYTGITQLKLEESKMEALKLYEEIDQLN